MNFTISTDARKYIDSTNIDSNRSKAVDPAVLRDHPAFELLARFGRMHFGIDQNNKMLHDIRADVAFEFTEPYGEIKRWEKLLRTRLVGVAEIHHRHSLLYLSDDERFFSLSGMHDGMGNNGTGFGDAIDNLFFGQSMPMLRPDQHSVRWYGIEYKQNAPELYRYELG